MWVVDVVLVVGVGQVEFFGFVVYFVYGVVGVLGVVGMYFFVEVDGCLLGMVVGEVLDFFGFFFDFFFDFCKSDFDGVQCVDVVMEWLCGLLVWGECGDFFQCLVGGVFEVVMVVKFDVVQCGVENQVVFFDGVVGLFVIDEVFEFCVDFVLGNKMVGDFCGFGVVEVQVVIVFGVGDGVGVVGVYIDRVFVFSYVGWVCVWGWQVW